MPFCTNCGSPAEGRFCAKCGGPVDATAGAAGQAPPSRSSGLQENVASALCYVLGLITGILFLVLTPYSQNKNIRFHAFQSIFLHVALIVIWIVLTTLLSWSLLFVGPLVWLAGILLWVFMIWKAYQNEKVVLPLIGPLAEKQA